ncbi:hypothetical protein EDF46_3011 [Frondihabitans sp. PhB188]|uniref:hypothetical protein n=1 Tax=Frondihabitans sp. PhB188 TaxID=2485200 RepID=UPI000F996A85|nr:hypothetical protein [Frondihabitans sp. PhB188]ROQ37552.1 hypothetical protein EDF46_3011 [Frondihabitans sp. PhB188]
MKKYMAAVVTATTCGLMLATGATSARSATAGGGLQAADPVLQQLESLGGLQTRAEIDAMTGTGRPVTVLVDQDGTYVSAVETAAVSPFAQ